MTDSQREFDIRELAAFRRNHPNLFKHTGGFETHDDFLLRRLDEARAALDDIRADCESTEPSWSDADCRLRCGILARAALGAETDAP